MSKFNIMTGAIFEGDPDYYPSKIAQLNEVDNIGHVYELYGSLRSSDTHLPTARPDFRLKEISREYLIEYVKCLHDRGLHFNYTMNSNFIGNLETISKNYSEIVKELKWLEDIVKIDRITCAHPILLDIICRHTKLPIEVSTIMNINSIQAPSELKKRYPNINKICMGIDKNRNIGFVHDMVKECKKHDIVLEIMISEFCGIGNMSCTQLHRNTCYNMHSLNMKENVARNGKNSDGTQQQPSVKGYPWTSNKCGCIFGRAVDPTTWLASRTIWPNEIEDYIDYTGVKSIKVTTRTAPANFAAFLTEAYAKGSYNNLLAGLWLALPASTLSARANFEKIQKAGEFAVPFTCEQLSTPRHISTTVPYVKSMLTGKFKFMDLFFRYSYIDWSNVLWVDKEDHELEIYESNWCHKWAKMLTEENDK